MKKLLLLLVLLALPFSALAEKQPIPQVLRFSQTTQPREDVRTNVYIQRTYPDTAHDQVDADMRVLIDDMTEAGRAHLPTGRIEIDKSYLKTGAFISRTGESWMSFLTVARIQHHREQIWVAFDARAYDMLTGKRLTLADLFTPDSPGWDVLAQAVRIQLNAYFPKEDCDPAALDALCARDALADTPFTLTGGSLRLHFRADCLYPGHQTLMHVRLPYRDIRPHMTAEAQRQTDNSRYNLVALTFDDGPAQVASINVVETLQRYGADATFFLVGQMMPKNHYVLACEHDGGFSMACHSYFHVTEGNIINNVRTEIDRFQEELSDVVGVQSTIMRAPGGNEKPWMMGDAGMPLIHWSTLAGDGAYTLDNSYQTFRLIAGNVGGGVKDGGVVLMHDLRTFCYQYLEMTLQRLEERGFLCVIVEEVFEAYDVDLQPNEVYYGAGDSWQDFQPY